MSENRNALRFESGSLETLRRIVEQQYGYTLLPKLATLEFTPRQEQMVKELLDPKPVREVSIIMNRRFMKRKIVGVVETIYSRKYSIRIDSTKRAKSYCREEKSALKQ